MSWEHALAIRQENYKKIPKRVPNPRRSPNEKKKVVVINHNLNKQITFGLASPVQIEVDSVGDMLQDISFESIPGDVVEFLASATTARASTEEIEGEIFFLNYSNRLCFE